MYEVVVSRDSAKALEKLTPQMQRRIVDAFEELKTNPFRGKHLKGELEGLLSIRVGEMRAVYDVDSKQRTVVVHAIGPRGDIYKK